MKFYQTRNQLSRKNFQKNVLAYGRSPAKSFYCEAKRVGVMCNKAFVDRKNYNRLRYEEPKKKKKILILIFKEALWS